MDLIVRHGDREARVRIEPLEDAVEVTVEDAGYRIERTTVGESARSLLIGGRQHEVSVGPLGDGRYRVTTSWGEEVVEVVDALTDLARRSHEGMAGSGKRRVEAYMPGKVVALLVSEGDKVAPGQGLVVLEAMKMENEIEAEAAGVVRRVFVSEGQAVEGGDPLFELE